MISVYPDPVPGFTATPTTTSILNPTILFTPTCLNGDTTYYWMDDANDTEVMNLVQPFSFTYSDTGGYWINQLVVNQYGCWAQDSQFVYIEW